MQLLTFAIFIPTLALIMWNNLDNPLQVIDTLKKEQLFRRQLHGNLKYPEHHSGILLLSIQNAMKNKHDNVIGQLHLLNLMASLGKAEY